MKPKRKRYDRWGKKSPSIKVPKETVDFRRCLATKEVLPATDMIRFCLSPENVMTPDLGRKLPGRGFWVQADAELIAMAVKKNLFGKGLSTKISYPENLDDLLMTLFYKRLQDLLGVVKKSGQLVVGFEKVSEALKKGQIVCLLEATDAADDGLEKMNRLKKDVEMLQILTAEQMANAIGTSICVHAGLKSGGATDLFLAESRRFSAYCNKKNI